MINWVAMKIEHRKGLVLTMVKDGKCPDCGYPLLWEYKKKYGG